MQALETGDQALKQIFEYIENSVADFLTQHGVFYGSKKRQSATKQMRAVSSPAYRDHLLNNCF